MIFLYKKKFNKNSNTYFFYNLSSQFFILHKFRFKILMIFEFFETLNKYLTTVLIVIFYFGLDHFFFRFKNYKTIFKVSLKQI